jgi:cysteine sulfinate desulfinase/cysteine desulfurase-like protein
MIPRQRQLSNSTDPECGSSATTAGFARTVVLAMGHIPGRALSAFRLTIGRWTTREDIEHAAREIAAGALAAPRDRDAVTVTL